MMETKPKTIDEKEVEYYEKLASTWWDPKGPFWPLHKLNELRIDWIIKQLRAAQGVTEPKRPLNKLSVLDVGCGGGILSESLAKQGANVTAIDVVERNIEIARAHADRGVLNIHYDCTDVEGLVASGCQYDVVFNMEVVEHVADVEVFLNACNGLVKPGGFHFIATINRNILAFMVAIVGAEYVLGWLPKGTHHYRKLVKPAEVKNTLMQSEFRLISETGVTVNPLTRRLKLVNPLWVNYMLFAQKETDRCEC